VWIPEDQARVPAGGVGTALALIYNSGASICNGVQLDQYATSHADSARNLHLSLILALQPTGYLLRIIIRSYDRMLWLERPLCP
jgi:hypothetical protein